MAKNKSAKQPSPQLNPIANATSWQQPTYKPAQVTLQVARAESRTIFDPSVVEAYEKMVPGAAARILSEFEKNGATSRAAQAALDGRQQLAIEKQAADNARRDWLAAALLLLLFALSGLFAWLKLPWLSGATLVGIASYVTIGFFKWRRR